MQTADSSNKLPVKQRYNALKKYTPFEGISGTNAAQSPTKLKGKMALPFFAVAFGSKKAGGKDKGDTAVSADEVKTL